MQKILEQKRGTRFRKFTLLEDRIQVETKSLAKNEKYDVMFENLGSNLSYQSDSTVLGKIFFYICLAVPIILTVAVILGSQIETGTLIFNYILWFGLALLNFLKKSQDDVFLVGGIQSMVLFRNVPTENEVMNFINTIKSAQKKYMIEKYTKVDVDIPQDLFFARLQWLKEREILNESEYTTIKKDYELKKLLWV